MKKHFWLSIVLLALCACGQKPPKALNGRISSSAETASKIPMVEYVVSEWQKAEKAEEAKPTNEPQVSHKYVHPPLLVNVLMELPSTRLAALVAELAAMDAETMAHEKRQVLEVAEYVLGKRGERGQLVLLLSHNPYGRRYCEENELEVNLAVLSLRTKPSIKAPILVLVESYEKAANPRARDILLTSMSLGFPSLRKAHPNNDTEFVQAVAKWYKTHLDKLQVNNDYICDPPEPGETGGRPKELFLLKPANTKP